MKKKKFILVMRSFNIHFLSNFQIHQRAVLSIVIMSYITSELITLQLEVIPFKTFTQFPHQTAASIKVQI